LETPIGEILKATIKRPLKKSAPYRTSQYPVLTHHADKEWIQCHKEKQKEERVEVATSVHE